MLHSQGSSRPWQRNNSFEKSSRKPSTRNKETRNSALLTGFETQNQETAVCELVSNRKTRNTSM